jgi:hypothetical protein
MYYPISDDNGREHLRELLREAEQERRAKEAAQAQDEGKSKLQSALLRLLSVVIR